MWKDIIIGEGKKGCSAERMFNIKDNESIYDAGNAFWISDCFLGLEMTIYKHTDEGKRLQALIDEGKDYHEINEWLDVVVLKHLPADKLKRRIEQEMQRCFNEGKAEKSMELCRVLDVGRYLALTNGRCNP